MTSWSAGNLIGKGWMSPLQPDRGGYTVTMRECSGADRVLQQLAAAPADAHPQRLHIGWGSFRNLDIMAARSSHWGLLLDINTHQFNVWDGVFEALRHTDGADDFVELAVDLIPEKPKLRQFANCSRHWLKADFLRPESWLSQEHPERFQHIRRLVRQGRISTACLDMRGGAGPDGFAVLATNLEAAQQLGIQLDSLYVSNIPWMLNQETGFFGESHHHHLPLCTTRATAQARNNLRQIGCLSQHVICAMHLTPEATRDNLHWDTRRYGAEEFFSGPVWQEMQQAQPNNPRGE